MGLNVIAILSCIVIGILLFLVFINYLGQLPVAYQKLLRFKGGQVLFSSLAMMMASIPPAILLFIQLNAEKSNNIGIQTIKELSGEAITSSLKSIIVEPQVMEKVEEESVESKQAYDEKEEAKTIAMVESEMEEEVFKQTRKENIIQEVPNPLPNWKGRKLTSLLNILKPEEQGVITFPTREEQEK